jgi:predicted transcriptional regulator
MARGPALTTVEKYAIQAMVEEKMPVSKIATKLGRSRNIIDKFIQEELSNTVKLIDGEEGFMPQEVEDALYKRLITGGLTKMDALSTIKRMKGKMTSKVVMSDEIIDALYKVALGKYTSVKDLMVTKTPGGRKGVAIMQESASSRMDLMRNSRPTRDVKDHIFRQEDAVE